MPSSRDGHRTGTSGHLHRCLYRNLGIERGDVLPNTNGEIVPPADDIMNQCNGRNDGMAMCQLIVQNFFQT